MSTKTTVIKTTDLDPLPELSVPWADTVRVCDFRHENDYDPPTGYAEADFPVGEDLVVRVEQQFTYDAALGWAAADYYPSPLVSTYGLGPDHDLSAEQARKAAAALVRAAEFVDELTRGQVGPGVGAGA